MATKKKPILVRIFRGEYKLDENFVSQNNLKNVNVYYNPSTTEKHDIRVNGLNVHFSSENITNIAELKTFSENSFKMVIVDVVRCIIYSAVSGKKDAFKKLSEFNTSDYYKILRRDVKHMIQEFVNIRREELMRKLFFDRITYTNSSDRLTVLKSVGKTFGYFAVPKDGMPYTDSVKNLILVKSDPRNGYGDIVHRTYRAIRDNNSEFDIFKNDPYIQLNSKLEESIIPYV